MQPVALPFEDIKTEVQDRVALFASVTACLPERVLCRYCLAVALLLA